MIRLATLQDIPDVVAIYDALHTLEERGKAVIGWRRGVYATRKHAMEALEAGQLYVDDQDGLIQAAAKINQTQEPAYFAVSWAYPAPPEQVLVMHTLVVSPAAQGKGCGTRFVKFYMELARQMGCACLRIDTNARNQVARRLYAKLGFREAGVIPTCFNGLPGVDLVCLEKKL